MTGTTIAALPDETEGHFESPPKGLSGATSTRTSTLVDTVLLSDDVGRQARCWVHAERLLHWLETFTDLHRTAQQRMRKLIWNFSADLKVYPDNPGKSRHLALRAGFDRIFHHRTGFVTLDRRPNS
ncbi:MAG TPA: hypothetical protein DDZ81_16330 [Acetobacteraceae bacterium]|nr:hypothetical protein [Acetobacteraceae bacterium]